ncbi:monovalent cation/H(+) antiporter subunit G [Parvularcula sp. LCG005]|uniref:monovalent cation/H(+) antiporter subunit G n=1 Tax=Parvularcula sp. LCG005 TaxID=3078805 RepID=UPI002941BB6E|nr:monovalent cation/H(+) antiporter subunit G [Parvularcula sp. LCG005]WOI53962.1 monovalent cation/H(+) antiporter subunit G [Parvularcula sp. LCG005]
MPVLETVLDILSWILFLLGGFFILTGAIGVIRFPDFYTRLHAAGVTDTLGADLILLAMVFQSDNWITIVKLFIIFVFLLLTSPVSTHAVAHAAWAKGLNPRTGKDLHYPEDDEDVIHPPKEVKP